MKDELLPPRPGEKPKKEEKPEDNQQVYCYVNGKPVCMSRIEALDLMAQLVQALMYLETPNDTENK